MTRALTRKAREFAGREQTAIDRYAKVKGEVIGNLVVEVCRQVRQRHCPDPLYFGA